MARVSLQSEKTPVKSMNSYQFVINRDFECECALCCGSRRAKLEISRGRWPYSAVRAGGVNGKLGAGEGEYNWKIYETKKKPKSTLLADNTQGLITKQTKPRPVAPAAPHHYPPKPPNSLNT